jgi:phosphate starvation-inducible PhoH-like protein
MAKRTNKRRQAQGVLNVQEFHATIGVSAICSSEGGYQPANDAHRDHSRQNVRLKSKGQRPDGHRYARHGPGAGPPAPAKLISPSPRRLKRRRARSAASCLTSAVEAGESLGFLPGAMEDKLAPYLRPLYDALQDRLSPKRLKALMAEGLIEIAPVGFMRGRTLNNAFVVIDEAQNCTYGQIKMLLTRLGWNSTMVVTGDPAQTDLLPDLSGLHTVADKLEGVANIAVCRLTETDIVRHPLVASMLGVL